MNDHEEASRLLRELAQQTDARALAACTESLLSLSHSKPFASAVAERDGAPLLVALLDNASAVVRAGAASCLATLCAHDEFGSRLLETAALPPILRLITEGAAALQLHGATVLANLASVNKNKRELVSGAVLEPLLALARTPAASTPPPLRPLRGHGLPSSSPPSAADETIEAQLQALRCISGLCSLHDFKASVEASHGFYATLLLLSDASDIERVLSKNSWSLEQRGGEAGIVGVQRVHPRDRKPPLGGWDVLQLLQLFGCGSLDELPWAAEPTLRALPSASLRF